MRCTPVVVALAALTSSALADNFLSAATWQDASITTTYEAATTVTMTLELVHTAPSYGFKPSSNSSSTVSSKTSSVVQKPTSSAAVSSQSTASSAPSAAPLPATGGSSSNGVDIFLAVAAAGAAVFWSS